MPQSTPMLHLVCGLAASGKSTLSADLGQSPGTIVIAEDLWLAPLFGDEMTTLQDYRQATTRLRRAIAPHIVSLLKNGISVVLDFPANTVEDRLWMREIIDTSGAAHRLHFLDVPPEVCLARLHARNARGEHPFAVSDEQFDRLAAHFAPPTLDEGFEIVKHRAR